MLGKNLKIEIIEDNSYGRLKKEINDFISDKVIADIKYSTLVYGQYHSSVEYTAMIIYVDPACVKRDEDAITSIVG